MKFIRTRGDSLVSDTNPDKMHQIKVLGRDKSFISRVGTGADLASLPHNFIHAILEQIVLLICSSRCRNELYKETMAKRKCLVTAQSLCPAWNRVNVCEQMSDSYIVMGY